MDFVVVGPTGVFTLEVKSHRGSISFHNGKLFKGGFGFEKDIIKQSMGQALFVHNVIQKKLGIKVFVHPVVVFSSIWSRLYFGLHKIRNVQIVQKKWLKKVITQNPLYHYKIERKLIEQEFEKLVEPEK